MSPLTAPELERWNALRERAGADPLTLPEAEQRLRIASDDSRRELLARIRE